MKSVLGTFIIIGFILISASVLTTGMLIVRYLSDMRSRGIPGGKEKK